MLSAFRLLLSGTLFLLKLDPLLPDIHCSAVLWILFITLHFSRLVPTPLNLLTLSAHSDLWFNWVFCPKSYIIIIIVVVVVVVVVINTRVFVYVEISHRTHRCMMMHIQSHTHTHTLAQHTAYFTLTRLQPLQAVLPRLCLTVHHQAVAVDMFDMLGSTNQTCRLVRLEPV